MTKSIGLRTARALALTCTVMLAGACGGRHHLGDYDFAGRSIAVVRLAPPAPELYTGGHEVASDNPLIAVIEAGSAVAVGLEARRARARLDSAAVVVDVAARLGDRTLQRAARYLGTRAVQGEAEADYLLEVDVRRFGIDASGSGPASLFVQGEAILLDAATGSEIWSEEVSARDRLTPSVGVADGSATGSIVTAAALTRVTVEDFARILEQLADYTADVITRELREDLRDARDDD